MSKNGSTVESNGSASAIGRRSVETDILVRRLSKMSVGETVSYDELSGAIGKDVRSVRGSLQTAMDAVLRDSGAFFDVVRGEGIIRISEADALKRLPSRARRFIQRKARRTRRKIAAVKYDELDDEQKKDWNLQMTVLGFHEHVEKPKASKVIEDGISRHRCVLNLEDVARSFLAT